MSPKRGGTTVDPRAVAEASAIFQLILKGLKNIGIYRHMRSRYNEFIEPAHKALTSFITQYGALSLKLTPYTLQYNKNVIYEEQSKENLTYKFYRDGMRFLVFREGIPIEELLAFLLLAIEAHSDADLEQEDTVTRLWKENLKFIEWVVVERFEFGDLSPEEVEIEVDKIVAYLRRQLAAHGADITRFARIDVEDLDLELQGVDQIRGGVVTGRPAKDQEKEWIQDQLLYEEKKRMFPKLVLILFQILERECRKDDFDTISEALSQILDALILAEDVSGIVAVVQRLDVLAARKDLDGKHRELIRLFRHRFVRRMAEPERLQALAQYVQLSKRYDSTALKAYLLALPFSEDLIPTLCTMLERVERSEGREVLIEVLAKLGKKHTKYFSDRLTEMSSNVVRDMLAILLLIDAPNKLQLFAPTLEHQNLMIRLEGLKAIANTQDPAALSYLEKAMKDTDPQMRLAAYRALPSYGVETAVPVLVRLMSEESFSSLERREQVTIASALGETRTREALQFFHDVFGKKGSFFNRTKINDLKHMAVVGLAAMGTVDAYNLLAMAVQDKAHGKEVIEAAHKAAVRLRTKFTSVPPPPERSEV